MADIITYNKLYKKCCKNDSEKRENKIPKTATFYIKSPGKKIAGVIDRGFKQNCCHPTENPNHKAHNQQELPRGNMSDSPDKKFP